MDESKNEIKLLVEDEVTKALAPAMEKMAELLASARDAGRFILLRFHHDADGISGALALSEALRFQAHQQNSATYGARDAVRDLGNISHEKQPLVVLVDFGSNRESVEGLELLKAAGMEIAIIDHHPPTGSGRPATAMLTPWDVSGAAQTSRYVAGYLCAEVARIMMAAAGAEGAGGKAEADAGIARYARIACAGDRSALLEAGADDRKAALVLDYLAAHSGYGNNLRFYKSVLSRQELFGSIAQRAQESIDEAADRALAGAKRTKDGGVEICTFGLEGVVRKGEWPGSSKITTCIFDRLKHGGPLLCVGYTGRSIIIRANDSAVARGLGANVLAERVKKGMADFVEGGGGHAKAGAIRVREGFTREVLNALVREAHAVAGNGNLA